MKKLTKRLGLFAMSVFALAGATGVNAAADTNLQSGLASTTAIFTDNYGEIITWVVGIFAITIVVLLVIRALFFAKRQAAGMLPGGRRKR